MSKEEKWIHEIEKEYGSLENYIKKRKRGGEEPLLFGYFPFQYLWEKGLLKERDIIRTNLQQGFVDGHYEITSIGDLKGIEEGTIYSGKPGIYKPKEILNTENSDNGWTIGFFAISRIVSLK